MAYSLLKDVNTDSGHCRLRVRITRFWEHVDASKNGELIRYQFVMADEQGGTMQASISKGQIGRFKGKIVEGQAYCLQFMDIKPARENYRAAEHRYEAWFTWWTKVTPINPVPQSLPRYAYKIKSFRHILDNIWDKTFLADVIGVITGVSSIVTLDVKGKPTSKRTLRLIDMRDTAIVTLWSENAEAINADQLIQMSKQEVVVALVMGCTFRTQDSVLALSASFGSQVCINIDNTDVVALRDRFHGAPYPIELLSEKGRRVESTEMKSTTITELSDMNPHVVLDKLFRCQIIIQDVPSDQNWWFRSCDECAWKALPEGNSYRCTKESCTSKSASPRYKIPITAGDGDSTVAMIFFGDVAQDLIGKSADVLLADNYVGTMPVEITNLIGRKYVVDVTVSRYSFRQDNISFRIEKFYPEGSAIFANFSPAAEVHVVPRKTTEPILSTTILPQGGEPVQAVATISVAGSTPAPPAILDTPIKGNSASLADDHDKHDVTPFDSERHTKKRDCDGHLKSSTSEHCDVQQKPSASKQLFPNKSTEPSERDPEIAQNKAHIPIRICLAK